MFHAPSHPALVGTLFFCYTQEFLDPYKGVPGIDLPCGNERENPRFLGLTHTREVELVYHICCPLRPTPRLLDGERASYCCPRPQGGGVFILLPEKAYF